MNHLKAVHFNVGICSIGYWTAKVIHSILQPVCPMTNDFPKAFSPQFLCSIAFGPLLPFKGDIAHESNYNNHFWYEEHFVLIVGFFRASREKNWAVLEKQAYKSDPSRYENSSWLLAFARLLMLLLYVCFEIKNDSPAPSSEEACWRSAFIH